LCACSRENVIVVTARSLLCEVLRAAMVAVVSFLLPSVVSEFLEVVVYGLSALAIALQRCRSWYQCLMLPGECIALLDSAQKPPASIEHRQ
jgi:hypothetical protein